MKSQTEERVDAFKEAKLLSLNDFLEIQLGEKGKAISGGIRYHSCPACGGPGKQLRISVLKDKDWSCFSCGEGGSIVDAASFLWGVSALDAAKTLAGIDDTERKVVLKQRNTNFKTAEQDKAVIEAKMFFFQKLREKLRGQVDEDVMSYLTDVRKLDKGLVLKAMERGIVSMLPSDSKKSLALLLSIASKEDLIAAEIWKKDAKLPGICFRPLVFFLPGAKSAEFRIIRDKKYEDESKSIRYGVSPTPYFWRGSNQAERRVLVTEGVIDMLSAVELGWQGNVMALPGTQSYKKFGLDWFLSCRRVNETSGFVIAFDNDVNTSDGKNPGQTSALELIEKLTEAGIPCINKPPQSGDINDFLKLSKS